MKSLAVLALLATSLAFAKDPTAICRYENPGAFIRNSLSTTPSYFFGMFPEKNWISYRGETSNWVLNLETGEQFSVPGTEDPVPMPDEKIISTPESMSFYSIADYQKGKSSDPLVDDHDIAGVYQSIGTLETGSASSPVYRVMSDDNTISFRDYRVTYNSNGEPSMEKLGTVVPACQGLDLKTPKLSKDGHMLSALDSGAKPPTTKIYSIADDGSCTQIDDLGFQTGKADFSYDGKKVVFHAGPGSMGSRHSFQEHPGKGDRLDVYEMTLKNHQVKQLTFNDANKNSYYPMYKRNGDVGYIDQTIHADGSEQFDIVMAKTGAINSIPLDALLSSSGDTCHEDQSEAAVLLGQTWLSLCSKVVQAPAGRAILRFGSLDTKECSQVVKETWKRIKSESAALGITRDALSAACPQSIKSPTLLKTGAITAIPAAKAAGEVFARKCDICHAGSIPFESLEKLKSTPSSTPGKTLYEEMVRRLKSDDPGVHMPRGANLSDHDLGLITTYLGTR